MAVDYLTAITKSLLNSNLKDKNFAPTKDKHVLVIGGGDTGNDCVGSAIRLGCKSVTQLEMMPELPAIRSDNNPWPEWRESKKQIMVKKKYCCFQSRSSYLSNNGKRIYSR